MTDHLDPHSLAQHLEGTGTSDQRAGWDQHLAECAACRQELSEVRRILASAPVRRRFPLVPLAAAAAALLLLWVGSTLRQPAESVTRDPETITSALAPTPIAPVGDVTRPRSAVWSAVAGATRYRITLFTGEGQAAWQATVADTFAAFPDTLQIPVATAQYWQVKAETGFGRWVESELVAFTIRRTDAPP